MPYYVKYPAHSVYEHGTFAAFATLEEAQAQAANDLLDPGVAIEAVVQSDSDLVLPDYGSGESFDANAAYSVVHDNAALVTMAPGLQKQALEAAQQAEVDYLLSIHDARPTNSVPGNAYTVCTGGTATAGAVALAAATAKTVIGITVGTANQPSIVEAAISFDGVTASAVPVLCEWVSGTAATAGTGSTAQTPKQIRGWPAQTSASTAAYGYGTEPTVLEVFKKRLITPNGGLIILQSPLGREPTGIITAATQFKFLGLRLTAPAIVNCHVDLEYEE
jgi:hypothetical protein